jgi:hypothetical protein
VVDFLVVLNQELEGSIGKARQLEATIAKSVAAILEV